MVKWVWVTVGVEGGTAVDGKERGGKGDSRLHVRCRIMGFEFHFPHRLLRLILLLSELEGKRLGSSII